MMRTLHGLPLACTQKLARPKAQVRDALHHQLRVVLRLAAEGAEACLLPVPITGSSHFASFGCLEEALHVYLCLLGRRRLMTNGCA